MIRHSYLQLTQTTALRRRFRLKAKLETIEMQTPSVKTTKGPRSRAFARRRCESSITQLQRSHYVLKSTLIVIVVAFRADCDHVEQLAVAQLGCHYADHFGLTRHFVSIA